MSSARPVEPAGDDSKAGDPAPTATFDDPVRVEAGEDPPHTPASPTRDRSPDA